MSDETKKGAIPENEMNRADKITMIDNESEGRDPEQSPHLNAQKTSRLDKIKKAFNDKMAPTIERFQKDKKEDRFDLENEFPEFKKWEAIGFSRPLGKELWQIITEQINNILFLFILVYLVPILRPFPEIDSIRGLADSLFAVFYTIFDVGTNFYIERFIAEHRVKDPRRMLMYVSFFIKYQMFTGVLQVTVLSYFTFEVIRYSNYAYLMWILLINLQKQWPGMLGIFKVVLSGLQHHAKVETMNLLQGEIVERITLIAFVLYGRYWGETNAGVGIIMGIVIYTQIGNYVDDIIFGFISMHFTNKVLKTYVGISLREVFNLKIDKAVYKEMLTLGIQNSILPVISSAVNTYILLLTTSNVAGFISYSAYIALGRRFSGVVGQYGDFGLATAIAESFSNGKKDLAEFYMSYSVRWRYFFMILLSMVMVSVMPYFIFLIDNTNSLNYYRGATVFFLPLLAVRFFDPLTGLFGPVMTGANKITEANILSAIAVPLRLIQAILFIEVFKLQDFGFAGMFYLLALGIIHPQNIINMILGYIYVRKKLLRIKIFWRATFLGPAIASLPVLVITQAFYYTAFQPMVSALGAEATIVIAMGLGVVVFIFTYFPLSTLFGFDDYMFSQFRQAVDLSGPSKPIFLAVYRLMKSMKNIAIKLKMWEKPGWSIPYDAAHKEVRELMQMKRESLQRFRNQ